MTSPVATADLLRPVLDDLATLVASISDDGLTNPTPCTELDVGALRGHVLSWVTTFAGGFADPDGRAPEQTPESTDPGPATSAEAGDIVRAAAARLDEAVRDGAGDRPLYLGESAMPGPMALEMILWEYQVHGWDLAAATGKPWQPAEAGVNASLAFAPGMLTPDFQGEGKTFAPAVTVEGDALALDRLVALSGRDPHWRKP